MSASRRYIALILPSATDSRILLMDTPNSEAAARWSTEELRDRALLTPGAFVTTVHGATLNDASDTARHNATAVYRAFHTPHVALAKNPGSWFVVYRNTSYDSGEFDLVKAIDAARISMEQYRAFADYLAASNQRAYLVDASTAAAALTEAQERFMDDLYESFAATA
ncbi:hypothetical protein [Streptomyces sp. NPDC001536]|uniref:hypothetical protein n=1 Tax=Streptomyces sp. NPDC001536 TaxID=3364583 RepID=UPI003680EAFE